MTRFPDGGKLPALIAVAAAFILCACGGGGGGSAAAGNALPIATGAPPQVQVSGSPRASSGPGATSQPSSNPSPGSGPAGKIKHVVIIIQENRTPDNLFNGLPGADTVRTGVLNTGQTIPLQQQPLAASIDPCHLHDCFVTDYDNGKNDGFNIARSDGMTSYSYVQESDVQPYFTLAEEYAFADRMFQDNTGPSFPAHLYLIAAQSASVDGLPFNNVQQDPHLWSCASLPTTEVQTLLPDGQNGPNVHPCFSFETLADDLEQHGHTWRSYAPAISQSGFIWSAFSAINQTFNNPIEWAKVVSPETTVLTDAPAGNLPDVTWVTPSATNSDHAGMGIANGGPDWVASVVNAIASGPLWNSTAIFITWDDWGGYYDHVVPPQIDYMGLGFRVPLIVVSPYVKPGYVSHVTHDFGSILHFAEETFGVPSLGGRDVTSDDFSDMFNFSQAPIKYQAIRTKLNADFFLTEPPSNRLPDDE